MVQALLGGSVAGLVYFYFEDEERCFDSGEKERRGEKKQELVSGRCRRRGCFLPFSSSNDLKMCCLLLRYSLPSNVHRNGLRRVAKRYAVDEVEVREHVMSLDRPEWVFRNERDVLLA